MQLIMHEKWSSDSGKNLASSTSSAGLGNGRWISPTLALLCVLRLQRYKKSAKILIAAFHPHNPGTHFSFTGGFCRPA